MMAETASLVAGKGLRLITYRSDRGDRAGLLLDAGIQDAADLTRDERDASVMAMLSNWGEALARLRHGLAKQADIKLVPISEVTQLAPLPLPGTIYCAGANYEDHAAEMAKANGTDVRPKSDRSWHFLKSSRTVVGPGAVVVLPRSSTKTDWEVELAAVIGRQCKDVGLSEALDYVAGYSIAIDLSARDLSRRSDVADSSPFKMDWLAHKNFDGSCPLGPYIVPADEIDDPQALSIELSVNGTLKQQSTTGSMIFSLAEQIRDLSQQITLWPGDVVLTGTPAGVGSSRGEFLKPGDAISARIDGLGELRSVMA